MPTHGHAGGGSYAALFTLESDHRADVGSLGEVRFPAGTYVYAGSAPRGLARHVGNLVSGDAAGRRHVDVLAGLADASDARSFPGHMDPCDLAAHLARLEGALPVIGFGATRCPCLTHLYGWVGSEPPGLGAHLEEFGGPSPARA